ncbi:MAG: hypothetical protein GY851_09875, partial [bacterium]|nr:hypothetical protein [bacterium]
MKISPKMAALMCFMIMLASAIFTLGLYFGQNSALPEGCLAVSLTILVLGASA